MGTLTENVVVKTEVKDEPEQKMEQEPSMGEKDESVKVAQSQAMEVDEAESSVKEEVRKEIKMLKIDFLPKEPGIDVLSIGEAAEDDEDEETVQISPDEVRSYLNEKICTFLKDPKINPILDLNRRSAELQDEMREKNDEFVKLNKLFDILYRNQEKFLRTVGILPKVPTNTIAVSVDLPILPSSVPTAQHQNNIFPKESKDSVLKKDWKDRKDLSITKVPMAASSKPTPTTKEAAKSSANADNANKPVPECIDLTDDADTPSSGANSASKVASLTLVKHPAPLPPKPFSNNDKTLPSVPPKPRLKIEVFEDRGIVLQWDMPPNSSPNPSYAKLASFDIFGYQEQKTIPINTLLWKKIGTVKAMNLPMACTLTQFVEGNRYHFSIRAVDIHNRMGSYSDPISVVYIPDKKKAAAKA